MEEVFEFLSDLSQNNNREWFARNKERYQASLDQFSELTEGLIAGITTFDPSLDGIDAKKAIFRIYKDVRFSKDKLPYKTHFGCWMTRGGRKSTDAGYYFHLEPGKSFAAAGVWMPPADKLKLIRQEILYNPEAYLKLMNDPVLHKRYERGGKEDMLKRGPAGFPKDFPHIEELKYKHFIFSRQKKNSDLTGSLTAKNLTDDFRGLYPLVSYLNQAMSFSGSY